MPVQIKSRHTANGILKEANFCLRRFKRFGILARRPRHCRQRQKPLPTRDPAPPNFRCPPLRTTSSPIWLRSASRRRPSIIRRYSRFEDSQALRGDIPGGHTKNLFVKDKKGRLFLLVLGEETTVDLKRVHEKIGAQGRVSFGSAELLEEVWGVKPGAVTPFGAINDRAGKVHVVLDEAMMRHERLNFHPLVNTRTTGLASADLIKFLRATGHEPLVVALGQDGPPVE